MKNRSSAAAQRDHLQPAKPFLKWAGGKAGVIPRYVELGLIPPAETIGTYYEPFLGAGAMFFHLRPRRGALADCNLELVETWLAIRDNVESVIRRLRSLAAARERVGAEKHYYSVREQKTRGKTIHAIAARMIYLNRTCWNGLYRVNRAGDFNVPFGKHKNPTICDAENLRAVAKLLAAPGVGFGCSGYENSLRCELTWTADGPPFVYLDPPYVPTSESSSFTAYSAGGFTLTDHVDLANACRELTRRGVRFMLSNSGDLGLRKLYDGFRIVEIEARRCINSKPAARGAVTEIVVMNYDPKRPERVERA